MIEPPTYDQLVDKLLGAQKEALEIGREYAIAKAKAEELHRQYIRTFKRQQELQKAVNDFVVKESGVKVDSNLIDAATHRKEPPHGSKS